MASRRKRRACRAQSPPPKGAATQSGEVSMRIKEAHTPPGIEVLEDEVAKQGALAEPGLPDHIEMLRPVFGCQKDKLLLVRDPVRAGADRDGGVVHGKSGAPPLFPSR